MADTEETEAPPSTTETPAPTPPATPPATPPPTPPANPPSSTHSSRDADIVTLIEGLPERVANAVREATASTSTPRETTSESSNPPATEERKAPGSRSFAEWWFGQ